MAFSPSADMTAYSLSYITLKGNSLAKPLVLTNISDHFKYLLSMLGLFGFLAPSHTIMVNLRHLYDNSIKHDDGSDYNYSNADDNHVLRCLFYVSMKRTFLVYVCSTAWDYISQQECFCSCVI